MSSDGFLHRYFLNNGDKRLHKWVHYFDIYERHFERFRNKNPVVLEIGVNRGGSLAMWSQYFGPGSQIIGIDVNPACKEHESEGIKVFIGRQDSTELIALIFEEFKRIDIVIDDGSHHSRHMIDSFNLLYDRLASNGVYLAEDTHTSYWSEYGGALRGKDTFIEFSKNKIDEINAVHAKGAILPNHFTATTDSITFYDSVVVFEKRPQGFRQAPMTHGLNFPR